MTIYSKMVIFHSYVNLPEGISHDFPMFIGFSMKQTNHLGLPHGTRPHGTGPQARPHLQHEDHIAPAHL